MTPMIRDSSGDVFRDLGFSASEAKDLRLRSDLLMHLQSILEGQGSQAEIAARLGVTQPRVSDLLRGKIQLFSLEALVDMLEKAGADVQLTVRHERAASTSLNYTTTSEAWISGTQKQPEVRPGGAAVSAAANTQLALAA